LAQVLFCNPEKNELLFSFSEQTLLPSSHFLLMVYEEFPLVLSPFFIFFDKTSAFSFLTLQLFFSKTGFSIYAAVFLRKTCLKLKDL